MLKILAILILSISVAKAESKFTSKEIHCLAQNIYFEARNQNNEGMKAVAHVTINRRNDFRYPNTICNVVKQAVYKNGRPVKYKCQFSWWCDGKHERIINKASYGTAIRIARELLFSLNRIDNTFGSTHYHRIDVSPQWASSLLPTIRIGVHQFYVWPTISMAYND